MTPAPRIDEDLIQAIAQRHGVSSDAVRVILQALIVGQGRMAQFNHPELGGMGQWQAGGMLMIGEMFNHTLKARVAALCADGAQLVAGLPAGSAGAASASPSWTMPGMGAPWWPGALGTPAATGGQDGVRYAFFAEARRLAIMYAGQVTIYDTLDHVIRGVSQQQGTQTTITFTSQWGTVALAALPVVARYAA